MQHSSRSGARELVLPRPLAAPASYLRQSTSSDILALGARVDRKYASLPSAIAKKESEDVSVQAKKAIEGYKDRLSAVEKRIDQSQSSLNQRIRESVKQLLPGIRTDIHDDVMSMAKLVIDERNIRVSWSKISEETRRDIVEGAIEACELRLRSRSTPRAEWADDLDTRTQQILCKVDEAMQISDKVESHDTRFTQLEEETLKGLSSCRRDMIEHQKESHGQIEEMIAEQIARVRRSDSSVMGQGRSDQQMKEAVAKVKEEMKIDLRSEMMGEMVQLKATMLSMQKRMNEMEDELRDHRVKARSVSAAIPSLPPTIIASGPISVNRAEPSDLLDTLTAAFHDTSTVEIDPSVRSSLISVACKWKNLGILEFLLRDSHPLWNLNNLIDQGLDVQKRNSGQRSLGSEKQDELKRRIAEHLEPCLSEMKRAYRDLAETLTMRDSTACVEQTAMREERKQLKSAWSDIIKAINTQHQSVIGDISHQRSAAIGAIDQAKVDVIAAVDHRAAEAIKVLDKKVDKLDETMLAFEARHATRPSQFSHLSRSDRASVVNNARTPWFERFHSNPNAGYPDINTASDYVFATQSSVLPANPDQDSPVVGMVRRASTDSTREIESVRSDISDILASVPDRPAFWEGIGLDDKPHRASEPASGAGVGRLNVKVHEEVEMQRAKKYKSGRKGKK